MDVSQTPMLAALFSSSPTEMMLRIPVVLLALTVHEFCHAYFALRMGDQTAYRLGRCSLNPLRHLDPLGTLCLLFAPIGWAKPVPIDPRNFRNWRQGVLVSTAAGPLSNLAQAIMFSLLLRGMRFIVAGTVWTTATAHLPVNPEVLANFFELMRDMFTLAVIVNVGLAVFNCLPIYPLDGFHITLQLLRRESQESFIRTAPAGPFMLIGLVLVSNHTQFDILGTLIHQPIRLMLGYVAGMWWML